MPDRSAVSHQEESGATPSSGKMSHFAGALAAANIVVGLFALVPLPLLLSFLAYLGGGPYAPQANHTSATLAGHRPPFEVDGDEASIVGFLVFGAAVVLCVLFAAVNAPVARLRPASVSGAAMWLWAVTISFVPSIGYVAWFFLTR